MRKQLRLSGSGGQGVITAAIILAEAAVAEGKEAAQSQSYGPEARGGMCQADTIISNEEIWFSKPEKPDVLLALTQASMNKFSRDTTPGSVIIADTGLSIPANCAASKIYRIPILETASKVVGKAMTDRLVDVSDAVHLLLVLHILEGIARHADDEQQHVVVVVVNSLLPIEVGVPLLSCLAAHCFGFLYVSSHSQIAPRHLAIGSYRRWQQHGGALVGDGPRQFLARLYIDRELSVR